MKDIRLNVTVRLDGNVYIDPVQRNELKLWVKTQVVDYVKAALKDGRITVDDLKNSFNLTSVSGKSHAL